MVQLNIRGILLLLLIVNQHTIPDLIFKDVAKTCLNPDTKYLGVLKR